MPGENETQEVLFPKRAADSDGRRRLPKGFPLMKANWQIRVYEAHRLIFAGEVAFPLEIGRQRSVDEELFVVKPTSDGWNRLVIAKLDEVNVSRAHVHITETEDGAIQIENKSTMQPVTLPQGPLAAQTSVQLKLPVEMIVGKKTIRLLGRGREEVEEPGSGSVHSLDVSLPPPSSGRAALHTRLASLALPDKRHDELSAEELVRWFQATTDVLQSAATSHEFFSCAARAAVELVGLDCGEVLLFEDDDWVTKAVEKAPDIKDHGDPIPSRHILSRIRSEKRPLWQVPPLSASGSLADITAVVAAPILNSTGDVIGVLYGHRLAEVA
ncbi:MAG: hypothetical protein KatS3mg105_4738 [Gemmatales bacterium]|nr:MAG: hypothetical protein KatS3mg105_4738 [Gemmatales bacterium]